MVIQRSYSINPPIGFPGQIAEPNSPMRVEAGRLFIAAADDRATGGARPGDAVFYDNANNGWRVAHNAATQVNIEGILSYPADTVANSDSIVAFQSGAEIEVVTMGVVWVIAGTASERGDQLVMAFDDFKFDSQTRVTAIANMHIVPIQNYNRTPAVDDAIIKAAIGYGRVI